MKRRNFFTTIAGAGSLLYAMDKGKRSMIVRSTRPEDLEMPLEGFLDEITPVEQFFVRAHDYVPSVNLQEWRLKVSGSVQKKRSCCRLTTSSGCLKST